AGNEQAPAPSLAYYHCDQIGTPQEVTDEAGEVAWSARYKAWGTALEVISDAASKAGITNPLRFAGQYFDRETGLHYNRYRYYDPSSGRFVSKDPIGLAGGINVYQYAPNPTLWIDPLGLARCPCEDDCAKILADEGVVTGRHGDLKKIGGLQDSHHIYQDASVNELPGYDYNAAPAISLQGRNADGTTRGTPHYMANRAQDKASVAGTLGSETVVAFNSLKAAGMSPKAAKCAVLNARGYFSGIGAGAGSSTKTPSKRG
ncbi:RHS domain-containing protein, partial [Burkholderia sp. AU30280]|uniref:RHS repeat-associated core domain-containing protein n=1 Tax=Burkholderia sp. AU30280 TaxID=2879628 RepID=UPI001CF1DC8C